MASCSQVTIPNNFLVFVILDHKPHYLWPSLLLLVVMLFWQLTSMERDLTGNGKSEGA